MSAGCTIAAATGHTGIRTGTEKNKFKVQADNEIFWIGNDPPSPLWNFSKNSSIMDRTGVPKIGTPWLSTTKRKSENLYTLLMVLCTPLDDQCQNC